MNELLASLPATTLVDVVIAITVIEIAALALWPRLRGRIDVGALMPSLVSGLLLMLAVRAAVGGADVAWIALPLALAGLAHLWDLRRRWQRHAAPHAAAARVAPVPIR